MGPDPAVRAANCARAGITQPFTSNVLSFAEPITVAGDPELKNETADSRSFGFVLTPLERMRLAIDYIKIDISQAIVSLDASNVLDACYDSPTYPNAYCGQVSRGGNGQITLVKTGYANAGFENFNGVTTEFQYSLNIPSVDSSGAYGTINFRLNHFFENQLTRSVGDEDISALAGSIGNSKHRAVLDIEWDRATVTVLWQTLFVGKAVWDNSLSAANTQLQGVGNWWVQNLSLGYEAAPHLQLRLVVDNLFDRQAPYPLPASPPNSTLPVPNATATYFSGILGRYFLATAEFKF
jgi:outer membrane receptor protein involved in Fe transport